MESEKTPVDGPLTNKNEHEASSTSSGIGGRRRGITYVRNARGEIEALTPKDLAEGWDLGTGRAHIQNLR